MLQTKVMRGPNIWAEQHHLCVIKLDNVILNTDSEAIHKKLDDMFQLMNRQGTGQRPEITIAACFAEVCQLLQQMAGCKVQFFTAKQKGENAFFSVYEYQEEEVGLEAARIAEGIFLTLINDNNYHNLQEDIMRLKNLVNELYLGPSTSAIVNEAKSRNIPVKTMSEGRFIFLGHGKYQKRIEGSICETTGSIAVDLAGDKNATKLLLEESLIPVPEGIVVESEKELHKAIEKYGFPLVTKPVCGHQGKNVTTNIDSPKELIKAFRHAQEYSRDVIVEKYIPGKDYRLLVINYQLVAAAERTPASVTGNGINTVKELVESVNSDPRRGTGHENMLTKITIDEISIRLLKEQGYTEDSVIPTGVTVLLKDTANLSTGGTAKDVTDEIHPENILLAERVAHIIGLDICGIDIMAETLSTPITENGGAVLEVNAAPGLRMHIAPSEGKPRNVGKAIIDLMFPNNSQGRIPIVAVTGTNGKTTTSRLMAFLAQLQGFNTGFTTTEGVYLNNAIIQSGDCTGPKSAAMVLHEPTVDFAVLECARGGILRSGLGYDYCDIGIVTNVAEDHLGMNDINTIEEMAEVKSVIPKSVKESGYAILNADNDFSYNMRKDLKCNVALFSLNENNARIAEHCSAGGIACVSDSEQNIIIKIGHEQMIILNAKDIPLTMNGKAVFMIENVLAVTLSAYLMKFSIETITAGLKAFKPDEHFVPGRMNMTDIKSVHVIVDYAHNPHSLKAFSLFMKSIDEFKTGIITGVGDRRKEDIIELGQLAAEMYDRVIIRIDDDTRGRSAEEIVYLLKHGIKSASDQEKVEVIPHFKDALKHAIETSPPNSYVVANVEKVFEAIDTVKELKEELENA